MGQPAPKNNIADPKTGTVTPEWLFWLQALADAVNARVETPPNTPPPLIADDAAGAAVIVNDYGAGTPGTLAKWAAPQMLGDSLITETGTVVTVHGTLVATALQGRYDGPTMATAAVFLSYSYNLATVEPPTGSQIRFNQAYPYSSVTKIWVPNMTLDGLDMRTLLLLQPANTTVYVQDKDDHSKFARFKTTGAPVAKTGYVEFPVSWVTDSGAALTVQQMQVVFV